MSNLLPSPTAEQCASEASEQATIEAFPARTTELGSLKIRRALPVRQRRLIGPWCFLDRYGPLSFAEGKPMDVAPHPHIGLQTVTWILQGEIVHDDSLGCEGLIRPGELSLMTAGSGIAHSEQTPSKNSGTLDGVQLWVALPEASRHQAAMYNHYMALPLIEQRGGVVTPIMGDILNQRSPGTAFSSLIGADATVHKGEALTLPLNPAFEHALFVLQGDASLEGQPLLLDTLYYLGMHRSELCVSSRDGARLLLIGGVPFEETILMWWNFVARTTAEIAGAREAWEQHELFADVKAYTGPRLRAPAFHARPIPSR